MCALRERGEVEPALIIAPVERGREGHERWLHVVQGAFHEALVILHARTCTQIQVKWKQARTYIRSVGWVVSLQGRGSLAGTSVNG